MKKFFNLPGRDNGKYGNNDDDDLYSQQIPDILYNVYTDNLIAVHEHQDKSGKP